MFQLASIHAVVVRRTPVQVLRVLALLPLLLFGQPASALIIPATDTGWYLADGTHDPDNVNFVTGLLFDSVFHVSVEYRNFFVFDLSGIGPVSNATLRAYLLSENEAFSGPGYLTPDASETWRLFDVTTNLGDLTGGAGGVSAFSDLGGGVAYGEAIVSADDMGSFIEVSLNADALASIGAVGGIWAVGGRLLDLGGANPELIFAWSHVNPQVELVLTRAVPAPTTSYLIALALGGLYWLRRRRVHSRAVIKLPRIRAIQGAA